MLLLLGHYVIETGEETNTEVILEMEFSRKLEILAVQ